MFEVLVPREESQPVEVTIKTTQWVDHVMRGRLRGMVRRCSKWHDVFAERVKLPYFAQNTVKMPRK